MNDSIMKQLKKEKIHVNEARIKALEIVLDASNEFEYTTAEHVKTELINWIDKWKEENKKHEESLSE